MKKLFTLLTAIVVALSASAVDYYLIGGFNGWALKQTNCKFTAKGDGTFVLDLNIPLTSGFKINDGTWENDNANFGAGGSLTPGQTYNLYAAGSSGNIEFAKKEMVLYDAHLEFNPTAKTLVVTGSEKEAETVYGIHGNIFGVSSWSTEKMTEENGKFVLKDKEIIDGQFGIKAMNSLTDAQTAWYSTNNANDANIVIDKSVKCIENGNTNFSIAGGTYTFTFDPTDKTLTVSGSIDTSYPETMYVIGTINGEGWNPQNVALMESNDEGVYTISNITFNEYSGSCGFALTVSKGNSDDDWDPINARRFGPSEKDRKAVEGENNVDGTGDVSWSIDPGEYNLTFNYVEKTLFVEKVGNVEVVVPDNVYVLGTLESGSWDPTNPQAMSNDGDGLYSITNLTILPENDGFGYFALVTVVAENADEDGWNYVNSNRFGPEENNTAVEPGEEMEVYKNGNAWMIGAGIYDMSFDFVEKTLVVEKVGEYVYPTPDNVYIIGTLPFDSWNPMVNAEMTKQEDGIFTIDKVTFAPDNGLGYFALTTVRGEWTDVNANRFGPAEKDWPAEPGENEVDGYGEFATWSIDPGTYSMTFDFVNKQLTIEKVTFDDNEELTAPVITKKPENGEAKIQVEPYHYLYYMAYVYTPKEDEPAAIASLNEPDGYIKRGAGTEEGEYTFSKAELENEVNGGQALKDNQSLIVSTYKMRSDGKLSPETIVAFNSQGGLSGIAEVEAEAGAVRYYNLQGVEVVNPESGLYIEVRGTTARKVAL